MYHPIWHLQFYDVGIRAQFGVAENERITGTLEILS